MRLERALTQKQAAQRVGISERRFREYERDGVPRNREGQVLLGLTRSRVALDAFSRVEILRHLLREALVEANLAGAEIDWQDWQLVEGPPAPGGQPSPPETEPETV